jgi:hypothetical protein
MLLSLVPVDRFCKTDTETDLTTLHYMTIIEPLTVSSKEALSLDSKQFTNNSNNKVIEEKQPTIFYYSENISLPQFYCTKKIQSSIRISVERISRVLLRTEVNDKRIMYNKVYFSNLSSTNLYTPTYMKQKLIIPQYHMRYQLVLLILI